MNTMNTVTPPGGRGGRGRRGGRGGRGGRGAEGRGGRGDNRSRNPTLAQNNGTIRGTSTQPIYSNATLASASGVPNPPSALAATLGQPGVGWTNVTTSPEGAAHLEELNRRSTMIGILNKNDSKTNIEGLDAEGVKSMLQGVLGQKQVIMEAVRRGNNMALLGRARRVCWKVPNVPRRPRKGRTRLFG